TRFYYNGMEFRLDWQAGTDQLVNVYRRPDTGDQALPDGYGCGGEPESPVYVGGRQYLTNCYTSNPTNGASIASIHLLRAGLAKAVAAVGSANEWSSLKTDELKPRWPEGVDLKGDRWKNQAAFVWSDVNDDNRLQPEEVTFLKAGTGGVTVMDDLSVVIARVDGVTKRLVPTGFSKGGAPLYDWARSESLAADVQGPTSSGGDQALAHPDGWTILSVAPKPFAPQSLCGVYKGQVRWSYPDPWPGLHASHESPVADRPGMIIGTTRLLGTFVTPKRGEAGPLWCINGNQGNMYLFTADGLFVAELFRDVRVGRSWSMPTAQRGMLLNDVSCHDENFWPSISQTTDGTVYLVDGGRTSLVRVDGLETIRRIEPMGLDVKADDLAAARAWCLEAEAKRQAASGSNALTVPLRAAAPTIDGKLDDWAGAEWATVDKRGVQAYFDSNSKPYNVTASLAVSGDRLYATWRTGDANVLTNTGEVANALFKTGGALDLMIGSDPTADAKRAKPVAGDQRLLVAMVKGKPRAMLYRAVVPGTKEPVPFSSPWRTITLDQVVDVSDQVQLAGAEGDFELSVPLALLGLKPASGMVLRGDLGLLRGNGFQTLQRVYWSNKASGITADVPSEAELTPSLWGKLVVK
ncbi:MAG: hypothetical protein HZB16_18385, partial [Armatimonadetes bacterium]|nr:hypothetical protein [Armatimonadota bacterium]